MSATSLSELLDLLDARRDGVFLLPNARAARELRARFDGWKRAAGEQAWEPPAVLSWGQWTASLWSDLVVAGAETRLLLNAAQEQSLWREIVAEDAANAGGSVESLAEMAAAGFALAAAYEAISRLRGFAATHDSRVFAGWAEAFLRRCGTKGYLPAALLEEALRAHADNAVLSLPAAMQLVGVGERTPSQESFLAAIRERGCTVVERELEAEDFGVRASVVAANEREELELAAGWVRRIVAAQPDARVAMLVPGLGEERAELEDVLREVLAPELQAVGSDLSSAPWEISGGAALGSVAMIADALALARWVDGTAAGAARERAAVIALPGGCGGSRCGGAVRCGLATAGDAASVGDKHNGAADDGRAGEGRAAAGVAAECAALSEARRRPDEAARVRGVDGVRARARPGGWMARGTRSDGD